MLEARERKGSKEESKAMEVRSTTADYSRPGCNQTGEAHHWPISAAGMSTSLPITTKLARAPRLGRNTGGCELFQPPPNQEGVRSRRATG